MQRAKPHTEKNRAGFTLIELMVVVGLMVLLLAFAVPAFQGIGRSAGINAAVHELRTTVSLARQWAITRRERTCVVFPDEFNNYTVETVDKALRSYAVYAGTNFITEWRMLPQNIIFDPEHRPSKNIFAAEVDGTLADLPFPHDDGNFDEFHVAGFIPRGIAAFEHDREVFLTEGFLTPQGASPGSPIFLPNRMLVSLDIYAHTGLFRIREYEPIP